MHYYNMTASHAFLEGDAMAMLTVRNLPDEVHRALRVRAAQHGHSTEAEVREILASAVKPETRVRVGDALAALGRTIGLTNEDVEILDRVKHKTPAEPLKFE
jgi:plasmid stability protein